jgi:hypothetical protein
VYGQSPVEDSRRTSIAAAITQISDLEDCRALAAACKQQHFIQKHHKVTEWMQSACLELLVMTGTNLSRVNTPFPLFKIDKWRIGPLTQGYSGWKETNREFKRSF